MIGKRAYKRVRSKVASILVSREAQDNAQTYPAFWGLNKASRANVELITRGAAAGVHLGRIHRHVVLTDSEVA